MSWSAVLQHLQQPEYVHVLINPVPLYGMAMAVFGLAAGLIARSRASRIIGLLMVLAVSAVTWFAYRYGYRGFDRVYAMSGGDAQAWLDVHKHRAVVTSIVFTIAAVLAAVSLIGEIKPFRFSLGLTVLTLIAAIAATGAAAWISQAGGQVRHSEFRSGPPA